MISGQYHEANPGQYHEKNPGQYEETDEGKYLEINPGQVSNQQVEWKQLSSKGNSSWLSGHQPSLTVRFTPFPVKLIVARIGGIWMVNFLKQSSLPGKELEKGCRTVRDLF